MDFPRKLLVSCPRCRSPRVSVPWDLPRSSQRRHLGRLLGLLWVSYIAFLLLGLLLGLLLLWLVPLLLYLLATAALVIRIASAFRAYRCFDCRFVWRP